MATTTNYGWTTPDDTALVKDGAAAIRSLGTAIDTSMNTALGTKKSGLVLLNTTSFSAVASQQISNVFSSTYDNYRLELQITAITSNPNIQLRFRDAGGDISTALYAYRARSFSSLGSGSDVDVQGRTQTLIQLTGQTLGETFGAGYDIFAPNQAVKTMGAGSGANQVGNLDVCGFSYNATTALTGFTIISSAGNITGSVSIYGYNK